MKDTDPDLDRQTLDADPDPAIDAEPSGLDFGSGSTTLCKAITMLNIMIETTIFHNFPKL
jgi:hypothetical protein